MKTLDFEVHSGKVLELARAHIEQRKAVDRRNRAIAKEAGATQFWTSLMDGTVSALNFGPNPAPADFKRPDRKGKSWPKKGTEWAKRFEAQTGYDARGFDIAHALGIPTSIQYSKEDTCGTSVLSHSFGSGVGFLYPSEYGPFALYLPDVAARVAGYEGEGYTVDDACKNFKPEFDGARPILKEEWDFTIAKHDLEEALARKEAA